LVPFFGRLGLSEVSSGKVLIALRLENSTVEAYKAAGRGYQTRMAAVLEKHAK